MNNKNRIFSFLLSLIMIMSVLFAGNCGVSADKLEFTNVTLSEDGVLTWDALDTEFIYYLHIDIPGKSYGYGIDLKTNSYDLHEKLYEDDQPGGTYGLLLIGLRVCVSFPYCFYAVVDASGNSIIVLRRRRLLP